MGGGQAIYNVSGNSVSYKPALDTLQTKGHTSQGTGPLMGGPKDYFLKTVRLPDEMHGVITPTPCSLMSSHLLLPSRWWGPLYLMHKFSVLAAGARLPHFLTLGRGRAGDSHRANGRVIPNYQTLIGGLSQSCDPKVN